MVANEKKLLRREYTSRINKVQDYIESNISEEFSLLKLAEIANFSPYHFHRVFCTMTGETLFQYIQRVRLEKAAFLLLANKKTPITQIALECGFSNQASFAKAFKAYFNMSASKFRTRACNEKKSGCEAESNMGKVFSEIVCYNSVVRNEQCLERQSYADIPYTVEVKNILDMHVVYIRHTGPYKKDVVLFEKLYARLFRWADARKLIDSKKTKWLTLCHDNPDITDDDKLRISVCMTVPANVEPDGEVGKLRINGGRYAVGHFELDENQYLEAWNSMFARWLPESGYQPADGVSFEHYLRNASDSADKHIVEIYIPVKPLK